MAKEPGIELNTLYPSQPADEVALPTEVAVATKESASDSPKAKCIVQ